MKHVCLLSAFNMNLTAMWSLLRCLGNTNAFFYTKRFALETTAVPEVRSQEQSLVAVMHVKSCLLFSFSYSKEKCNCFFPTWKCAAFGVSGVCVRNVFDEPGSNGAHL